MFANCLLVKGAKRSIICDVQNNLYYFIPNSLFKILDSFSGKTVNYVKKEFDNEHDDVIDEYFDFLHSKNLIFYHSGPELFPKLSLDWKSPSPITNAIIDYGELNHDFFEILQQLELLKCSNLQLRFFSHKPISLIEELFSIIEKERSRISHVDIVLPFYTGLAELDFQEFFKNHPRIHSLVLYNSPFRRSDKPIWNRLGYLIHTDRNIKNIKHCGIISTEYFYSNIKLFSESQSHNSCLNRKISIDTKGNIKNCPSMPQSFGNITNTTLQDALAHPDFKKYWNITKDQIAVCKDCEFRYICTDCRAYLENPKDQYSKPLKCGYDPYTNQWEEWSTNPLKQKAIEYYGMQDLVKKDA